MDQPDQLIPSALMSWPECPGMLPCAVIVQIFRPAQSALPRLLHLIVEGSIIDYHFRIVSSFATNNMQHAATPRQHHHGLTTLSRFPADPENGPIAGRRRPSGMSWHELATTPWPSRAKAGRGHQIGPEMFLISSSRFIPPGSATAIRKRPAVGMIYLMMIKIG